jgi:hypothetical protein
MHQAASVAITQSGITYHYAAIIESVHEPVTRAVPPNFTS